MKRLLLLFPFLLLFEPSAAHEIKSGNLTIIHPMVAEAAKGQATAQGSITIRNDGTSPDHLLSISAEFAGQRNDWPAVPSGCSRPWRNGHYNHFREYQAQAR
jgi:copper(I)-binding protein